MVFLFPVKLEHLVQQPSDSRYWVQDFVNLEKWDEKRQSKQLEKLMSELFGSPESPLEISRYFDILYSFVQQISTLAPDTQKKLVELITAGFNEVITLSEKKFGQSEAFLDHYKMYITLIYGIFIKSKTFDSTKSLKVLNKSLLSIKKFYLPEKPEDRLAEIITEIVFSEIERGKDEEIIEMMKWVKETEKTEIWEGWRAKAVNILYGENESCVKPMVSIVKNDPSLLDKFLSCLAESVLSTDQITETQGVKNVGLFIEKLTVKLPKEMLINVSVIVSLLNCESYSLRNSIVAAIGEILCFIIKRDKDQSAERDTYTNYREQLLSILKSRVMDKSGYCRAKVLDAFHTLNKEELLPRDWFIPVLNIASSRLLDCAVLVRRKATTLLESLIYQNKLLEGDMKIEPVENIKAQFDKHSDILKKLELAQDGQFDDSTSHLEKEEIQQQSIKTQILLKFLDSYIEMTTIFQNSVKILLELLKSKNTSDILGAIDVLVACSLRGLGNCNNIMAFMLSLVSSSDPAIRKKITDAFFNIYLNKKFNTEESSIKMLFDMIESLNIGELSCLESLFIELFAAQMVTSDLKKLIWKKFKTEESYPAACVLRFMSTSCEKNFLERRYEAFASRTLSLSRNWQIFRECLLSFSHLESQGDKTEQFIFKSVHELFELKDSGWFAVSEQVIRTASIVCENPMLVLKALAIKCLKILIEGNNSEYDLSKVVYMGGEIAMKVVVYGDKIANEYEKKIDVSKKNDELDEINGGRAAQVKLEVKAIKTAQENIVFEGLVSKFTPIILGLTKKIDEAKTIVLKKVLVISLSKLMCINPKICEEYLPKLIEIAQKNEDEGIRSTAIISLGDLVMRHPNMLEEQSVHLFGLLSDPCIQVRRKALLIISHLVLNDMLKMKGLMVNILKCYLDLDLKGVVSVFIDELNKKDLNAIYNMIPDSINNLLKSDVSHQEFKTISDMIFTYITKDKQGENLLEKLSSRFKDGNKDECLNIGYCLTKIPITEKAMRKLLDSVSWWQNKVLSDSQLGSYFSDLAAKCRRNWKNESKLLIDEFDAALRGEEEVLRKRKNRNTQ